MKIKRILSVITSLFQRKDEFSIKIARKYDTSNVDYYASAYMVFHTIYKDKKNGIVPLYAKSKYITYQVQQYATREVVREIIYKKEDKDPTALLKHINPSQFFQSINISTRRAWGEIFYSLSKEYESFYQEQYHKKPDKEIDQSETTVYLKKELIHHHEVDQVEDDSITVIRKRIEEKEEVVKELEQKIDYFIRQVSIHEELLVKQKKIQEEKVEEKVNGNIEKITQNVVDRLENQLMQERMRHGF